jgi:hypothetical protein
MNENEKFWQRFGGMIRKAQDDCPFTPAQSQKELDALRPAEEQPLSDEAIDKAIEKVLNGDLEPEGGEPDVGWVDSYAGSEVEEDVFALNRNKGEEDPEVEAKLRELRKKADDEEDDDDQDEPGLEAPKSPLGNGG